MTLSQDGRAPSQRRPGPKPRGRTVVPLTITVTHAQRAALDARADAEQRSISVIVRRYIAVGLAASMAILTALIAVISTRQIGAGGHLAAWITKESRRWMHTRSRAWRSSRCRRGRNWGTSRSRSST